MERIYTNEEICAQRELDKARREAEWQTLYEQAGGGERGEEIVSAFKTLYTLYEPELADWFSKLYDPQEGGYYATTSGHDTEGFGPDIEATKQSLVFIESSGMLRDVGPIEEALPDGMAESIVKFIKRRQHPNGYFYHPQWTFDDVHYNLARRGRDLGFALGVLNMFGAAPTYDTPSGVIGDGIDADGNPVEKPVVQTTSNRSDKEKTTVTPYPEYLENKETFLRYLDTIDINNRSYWFGNQLNATRIQIKARNDALIAEGADYSLCDILINWLNERIDPETGFWGHTVNMAGSNGFFKIIPLYNSWKYPYPMPEKVANSVLSNIMGDEIPSGNCCSVYNLWSAIVSIKSNVRKTQSEDVRDAVLARIDEILRTRGGEAILNTYKKMAPFRKGKMFSGSYTSCGGCQQTLYVGLNPTYGVLEGNVDAACICSTGLTRTMFDAFEFTRPSLLTKADWMVYRNNLVTYGPAKKIRFLDPLVTFEGEEIPQTVVPFGDSEIMLSGGKLFVKLDGVDRGLNIIQTARICKGDYKLFEADMTLSDVTGDSKILITTNMNTENIRATGFVELSVSGDKIKFENTKWAEGFSAVCDCPGGSFKLRMEIFLDPRARKAGSDKKCSAARVFVNGKYIGTYVNDDGTEEMFPSGTALNNENRITVVGIGNTTATLSLGSVRYSYHTAD